jgi:hypothetical protein
MRRLAVIAVSSFGLAFLLPARADAQFGGLMRRAAEHVVNRDKSSSNQPKIDDAAVTQLLTGLTEEARIADSVSRAAMAQNAAVVKEVDAFLGRLATYSAARAESKREQQRYESCVGAPSQELTSMAQPGSASPNAMAFAQRMESMSDEERDAFQAKMDKLEKEAKAAEKSGDVAEQQRIRAEIQKLTGMPMTPTASPRSPAEIKKMQAAGNRIQQCPMPKQIAVREPEPIMVRPVVTENGVTKLAPSATREIADSIGAQNYLTSLRAMYVGNVSIEGGARAAGVDKGQYALLRERVLYIYANSIMHDASAHPSGFSDEEYDALESHRSAIVAVAQRLKQLGAF